MKTRQSNKLTKSSARGRCESFNQAKASAISSADANSKTSPQDEKSSAPPRRSPRFVSPIGYAKNSSSAMVKTNDQTLTDNEKKEKQWSS